MKAAVSTGLLAVSASGEVPAGSAVGAVVGAGAAGAVVGFGAAVGAAVGAAAAAVVAAVVGAAGLAVVGTGAAVGAGAAVVHAPRSMLRPASNGTVDRNTFSKRTPRTTDIIASPSAARAGRGRPRR